MPKDTKYERDERTKELKCLYQVSDLLNQSDMKLDEIIEKILYLIQSATGFPKLTSVMIKVSDKEYITQNFKKTNWKISNRVTDRKNNIFIEVYYMEDIDFAAEKIDLIEDIGFRLKVFIKQEDNIKQ